VFVTVEDTRGEREGLKDVVLVMHMVVLRDKVTVTLVVNEVLPLTDVEPDVDLVDTNVFVIVLLVVID